MEIKISFCVSGHVVQRLEIVDHSYTARQIVDMLNKGIAVTTIQEGGTLDITETGKVIAKVIDVQNNCEYSEFDLE